jgi:hypothetical protein
MRCNIGLFGHCSDLQQNRPLFLNNLCCVIQNLNALTIHSRNNNNNNNNIINPPVNKR